MGNHAVAYGVKLARAEVIAAYPITPQTQTVEKIAEMTDNKEKLVFGFSPERADYPSVISGINMKLIDCTGWRPKVNIDEGLVKTMEFYKNYE